MSAKEQIFSARDVRVDPVAVPEWPVPVFVRVMSGKSRDRFEKAVTGQRSSKTVDTSGLRALMVVLSCCDENGALYFDESDIPAIEEKSADVLQRIFDAAVAINHMNSESAESDRSDFTTAES